MKPFSPDRCSRDQSLEEKFWRDLRIWYWSIRYCLFKSANNIGVDLSYGTISVVIFRNEIHVVVNDLDSTSIRVFRIVCDGSHPSVPRCREEQMTSGIA